VIFPSQVIALEPGREVGRPKGLCAVKGDPIPWVVQVEEERERGCIGVCCGVEPGYWDAKLWRVESQEGHTSLWTHSLSSGVDFC
jgi:hypothetical protein